MKGFGICMMLMCCISCEFVKNGFVNEGLSEVKINNCNLIINVKVDGLVWGVLIFGVYIKCYKVNVLKF